MLDEIGTGRWVGPTALSPDGRYFVAGISDGIYSEVVAFEVSSGRLLWERFPGEPIGNLAIDKTSNQLAVALNIILCPEPHHVQLWNLQTGQSLSLLENRYQMSEAAAVQYTADGERLVAIVGARVVFWDAKTGKSILTIEPPEDEENKVVTRNSVYFSVSADRKKVAVTAYHTVYLWDAITGKSLGTLGGSPTSLVHDGTLNADGTLLCLRSRKEFDFSISGVPPTQTYIYSTISKKLLRTFDPSYSPLWFDSKGDLLIIGPDGVHQWNPKINALSPPVPMKEVGLFRLPNGDLGRLDGRRSDQGGGLRAEEDQPVTLTNVTTGQLIQKFVFPDRKTPR